MVDLIKITRDRWFRPGDVTAATDSSAKKGNQKKGPELYTIELTRLSEESQKRLKRLAAKQGGTLQVGNALTRRILLSGTASFPRQSGTML